jgi:hypothetical protein
VKFYIASLPVFLLMTIPHVIVLALQSLTLLRRSLPLLPLLPMFFVAITLTTIGSLVYFRLMGRLAWVIDNQIPVDSEAAVETESEEDVAMAP